MNYLTLQYETCFRPGVKLAPFTECQIDTGDVLPGATTPYRLSPSRKVYTNKRYRKAIQFQLGDKVWAALHPLSSAARQKTAKSMPKRDRQYIVVI
ncbi:hypothetical protein NPIL_211501 [Nephila pilipes]|uniref:Uncharacterized protein n=1 Tax=Nephila pilipes TaxID=299642 RepID=A0A8X6ITL4_NEPPI|nr:hypothetical protein NPIL_211501 [Nephila pilipes]